MSRSAWIRIFVALLVAFAALLLMRQHMAIGAPLAQDSISAGRQLAQAWCKDCHALEAVSAGASSRAPDFVRIANRTSTTELSLKVFLRSNHRNMPNLIITPDQADDLARFILSLRRD
jgi:cytochrome c